MKKIVLTIIVVTLTILNLFLFKDYYKKRENYNLNKISQKYFKIEVHCLNFNFCFL